MAEARTRRRSWWLPPKPFVITADPTDNRILECAVAADSDVIVTGDRHLLALGNFQGIDVMTVTDFLSEFRGGSR